MESVFKICSKGSCGIQITGLEREGDQYKAEDNNIQSLRTYKYTESITINIIASINYEGDIINPDVELVTHDLNGIDNVVYNYTKDGLHLIAHIILPTQKMLNDKNLYEDFIYFDEYDNNIKHYIGEEKKEIEILEAVDLLNIDPLDTNTVIRSDKQTFCLCFLNECYYRICKDLLTKFCGKCINKLQKDTQTVYNRDIVWMTISVIKYLIEFGQYKEAQRILESITQCGNICDTLTSNKGNSCGCS